MCGVIRGGAGYGGMQRLWKWIKILCLGIFLAWQAVEDFRNKTIRMDLVLIFGILGIILSFPNGESWTRVLKEILISCLPGILLFVFSHICPGMIGDGDGFIFLITGIYMGMIQNWLLIYMSFLIVGVVGIINLFVSKEKKKAKCYPFVPFIFSAFVMIEMWGMRV